MIVPRYRIGRSGMPGAGQGLFVEEAVAAGRVVIAPDGITQLRRWEELAPLPSEHPEKRSAVRWFEDVFSVCPEWTDECYVNHSFAPNCVWLLGFVVAVRPLAPGEEVTMDYRHLLREGQREDFLDAATGREIAGLPWAEALAAAAAAVAAAARISCNLASPAGVAHVTQPND